MPLNTFQGMGHSVGLTITDSTGAVINPAEASIRNILVFVYSKLTGDVIGQFCRDATTGFELADITTIPNVMVFYLNDERSQSKHIGYYECEVHLQVFDSNFENGYRTMIQKCMLLNLNSANNA